MISKTQVDKLGERLRKGDITEADLRMLDEYRRSFLEAYEFVLKAIRNELRLEPTGRPAKSTTAIIEKLVRESIRLSQVPDVAGCRVVVPGIAQQETVVSDLSSVFDNVTVVDRRERPTNGYRAVHLIIHTSGKLVEIQVRTLLQHGWAELSEKAADLIDPDIKYGGGDPRVIEALLNTSTLFAVEESKELKFAKIEPRAQRLLSLRDVTPEQQQELSEIRDLMDGWRERHTVVRKEIMAALQDVLEDFPGGERDDAVSD